jgi:hypothetical protein
MRGRSFTSFRMTGTFSVPEDEGSREREVPAICYPHPPNKIKKTVIPNDHAKA